MRRAVRARLGVPEWFFVTLLCSRGGAGSLLSALPEVVEHNNDKEMRFI